MGTLMNYSQLRRKIYRNEIKQLVAAVSQLGKVFVLFFINVLVPLFLYLAMYGVSLIAEQKTLIDQRIYYQSIYLVVIFAMIKIQAKAILGTPYQHYIKDLPITPAQHRRSDLALTAQAGNLVLFAPLALCLFMPDLKTIVETRFFVLFSLMVLLSSLTAIYQRNLPLLSLVLLPVLAHYFYPKEGSANTLNTLWFIAVLLEVLFLDKLKFRVRRVKTTSYAVMVSLFAIHRPVNVLTRVLGTLAIIGSYAYVVSKRPDFATENFHLFITFLIGLLIGSYQFEIERFRSQYQYYLSGLPLSATKRRAFELLPLVVLSVVPTMVYLTAIEFTPWVIAWQVGLIFLTAGAVVRLGKHYYLAPMAVMTVLIFSLGFDGLGM